MGKWVVILLAVMLGLAVLGFLIDAARFLVGVAIVGALVVLGFQLITGKRS